MGSWPELQYIIISINCKSAMQKNKTKTKRNKTAIRLIGKGMERKRTLLYCQLFQRQGSSMGHCKLKSIQINQIESNQMQLLEESGKPKYRENKKQKRRAENQEILSQINDNLSYKETL